MNSVNTPTSSWDARSTAELIEHIVRTYHEPLRIDFPRLIDAARKVERVHHDKPGVPVGLTDVLAEFWQEMQQHMLKEENVLFPMLRGGARGPQVYMPVRVMEHEHEEHLAHLTKVRELTSNLETPAHACATWTALYRGLAALETELMEHVHLENNVLFRRAAGHEAE